MSSELSRTITFGVLLIPTYQLIDAAGPIDHIHNHSREMLKLFLFPKQYVDMAPSIKWCFISCTGTLDPILPASGPPQLPTTTFEACPPLDYLLVPGQDPRYRLSEACIKFIQTRFLEVKGVLTISTGSLILAQTGILNGHQVTTNKIALRRLAEAGLIDKMVNWVKDRRFVVDRKIWSAGGLTSGVDLAAEWVRTHIHSDIVKEMIDFGEHIGHPAQPDPFARLLEGVDF